MRLEPKQSDDDDEPRVTGTVSQLAKLVRHSTKDSMNKTTGNLGSFKNHKRVLRTSDQNEEKKDPSEIFKEFIMPKHQSFIDFKRQQPRPQKNEDKAHENRFS